MVFLMEKRTTVTAKRFAMLWSSLVPRRELSLLWGVDQSRVYCDIPLTVMRCVLGALCVGLTCCFLVQRLPDNSTAQKLPSSGLNPETAQGDVLLAVRSLSFQLCPPCITHTHTHTEMKYVNLNLGLVFIAVSFLS